MDLIPIARDTVMEHIPEMVFVLDAHDRLLDANAMAQKWLGKNMDEILGQAVKAFVALERGAELRPADVTRECQKRLEGFMVPKYVQIVDSLPKSSNGKIIKVGLQ